MLFRTSIYIFWMFYKIFVSLLKVMHVFDRLFSTLDLNVSSVPNVMCPVIYRGMKIQNNAENEKQIFLLSLLSWWWFQKIKVVKHDLARTTIFLAIEDLQKLMIFNLELKIEIKFHPSVSILFVNTMNDASFIKFELFPIVTFCGFYNSLSRKFLRLPSGIKKKNDTFSLGKSSFFFLEAMNAFTVI